MRHHDGGHPCIYSRLEGWKLHRLQSTQRMRHAGQFQMAVLGGVPVAWEVLGACSHALILHGVDPGCPHLRNHRRVPAERALAYNWVGGVGVNIHDRSKIHVDVHRAHLLPQNLPCGRCCTELVHGGAEGVRRRHRCEERRRQPGNAPALLIHHDEQLPVPSLPLQIFAQLCHLFGVVHVASKQNDPASTLADHVTSMNVWLGSRSVEAKHQQLRRKCFYLSIVH
mmetsp:Transcript_11282/g.21364  ORF Transcript_11282/g.21364 Transcript_11282/m.21364 type:complete len:225 (+) Transcript_11282:697-1371(+)